MGELDEAGTFRSVLGTLDAASVALRPEHVDTAGARLVGFLGDDPTPHELPATRTGDRFVTGPIAGDPLYVAAIIDGTPWLVATRRARRWE
jgi:hypothetical protein